MAQLNLTDQEVALLLDLIQSDQSDLRMEIADTDDRHFRDHLKENKAIIQSIIEKLQSSAQTTEQRTRAPM